MDTDGIANELDTFASWPRAFTFQELADFADSDIDREMLQRALLSDRRFIPLGREQSNDDRFVPRRVLFGWFARLSWRLARARQARLNERQLATAMNSLRAAGRWDVPPPEIIEFGRRFGFCGPAWASEQYVFPLARILSFLSPAWIRVAGAVLRSFAEVEDWDLALNQPLENLVQEGLSKFRARVVHVVKAREGFLTGSRMTLAQIGTDLNLTRERIRQIEALFWKNLREPPKRKALIQPFLVALLCDVMGRQGSLVASTDSPDVSLRTFIAKCAGVPVVELPYAKVVILGTRPADVATFRSPRWSPGGVDEDSMARLLDSEGRLLLVDSDVKALARSMAQFATKDLNKAQRVYLSLREIGKPAHYAAVTEIYNRLFPDDPSTERSIHAVLHRQQYGVVWIGVSGTFALKEWGYERPSKTLFEAVADIVEKQYEATGTPVPFAVIAAEMGKLRRVVKSSSLIFATHLNPRLRRVSSDSFVPRAPDDQVEQEIPEDELDTILQEFEESVVGDSDDTFGTRGERVPDMETVPRGRGRFARLGSIVKDAFFAKRDQSRDRNLVEPEGDQRQIEEEERAEVVDQGPGARAGDTRSAAVELEAGVTTRPPESAAVPSEEQGADPEYEPVVQPRTEGKQQTDGLATLLRSRGFEVIDERSHGGYLWVVGGKELYSFLSSRGFIWGPRGSPATGNRAGWYLR